MGDVTFAPSRDLREEAFWTCDFKDWGLRETLMPLPQFHPRAAPLRGRTRVTLCGMTFRSHLDPDPSRRPAGVYQVLVGQRGCTVLPEESRSHRCMVVLGV